jgi:hypothetical protein
MKHRCETQDDKGQVCGKKVPKKQWKQDGMCSRCAELLWSNFYEPLGVGKETKPIVFKEK